MPHVRELDPEGTVAAFSALTELRPHYGTPEALARQVNEVQRAEGYRLVASFDEGDESAAAVAGFRTGHNLAWGHYLYVDDLVTRSDARKRGHAAALMEWLVAEARRLGCDELHLDSGTHRKAAHRFYLKNGLAISSFHFSNDLDSMTM